MSRAVLFILFSVLQLSFASEVYAKNTCQSLFSQNAVSEKDLLGLKPSSLDSKDITTLKVSVDMNDFGQVNGKLIKPENTSIVNRLAMDLKNIDTVLIVADEIPTSGVFTTNIDYTVSGDTEKNGSAIILKSNAFNGIVLEHEMFHALNYYQMKNDIRTVFDGVIAPNSYRDMIQPEWKNHLSYKRLTGEEVRGEILADKFRSAYEEIDIEEVRTFVMQLKRRTFSSKKLSSILSESEMGDTLVPAQFFVKNFRKFSQSAHEQLETYVKTKTQSEIMGRISFTLPDVTLATDPKIVKRKVNLFFDDMSYTFENIPKDKYNKIVNLLKNGEKNKIPEVILPFMRKKLKDQSILAAKLDYQLDIVLNQLYQVKNKESLSEAESKNLKTALDQLVKTIN